MNNIQEVDKMRHTIQAFFITVTLSAFTFADVFMTELTDPQNSSDAGRYVELYNNGDSDVDLSTGWKIQRWTNGNADPTSSSIKDLTGTIAAGGFYIICNDADKFSTTYGLICDQDIGTGGAADSNGDDNMAILDASGAIVDMFGVAGEDGSETWHEFENGRAERNADATTGCTDTAGCDSYWTCDNDSGGGDGPQDAPEGFDPGIWIGADPASDTCDDESACNTGADGACEYQEDCSGECGGDAVVDVCDVCDGDGTSCSIPGCMDDTACNYNPDAMEDDGSCLENDCAGDCGGSAVVDECGQCNGLIESVNDCGPIDDLFISEYIKGSSNNKAIEIYNGTGADVELGVYNLWQINNGGIWFEKELELPDSTLEAGDVFVVCRASADEAILIVCDDTTNSSVMNFNGDDAIGLARDSVLIDAVGKAGVDPGDGWDVAGKLNATKDHTLVRKTTEAGGNLGGYLNWDISAGTDAENSEWEVYAKDTLNYLGSHNYKTMSIRNDGTVPAQFVLLPNYPNPFNPATTISFSIPEFGLTTITAYDITGRQLETLTNEVLSVGSYSLSWNASSNPSGVYLIRMISGEFAQTQKVVLVK